MRCNFMPQCCANVTSQWLWTQSRASLINFGTQGTAFLSGIVLAVLLGTLACHARESEESRTNSFTLLIRNG
jgi:hypothetical protein